MTTVWRKNLNYLVDKTSNHKTDIAPLPTAGAGGEGGTSRATTGTTVTKLSKLWW